MKILFLIFLIFLSLFILNINCNEDSINNSLNINNNINNKNNSSNNNIIINSSYNNNSIGDGGEYKNPIQCYGYINLNERLKEKFFSRNDQIKLLESISISLVSSDGNVRNISSISDGGYFSFTINKKNKYSLVIMSPNGWNFNREILSLDYELEMCLNEINFEFQGFTVEGSIKPLDSCKSSYDFLHHVQFHQNYDHQNHLNLNEPEFNNFNKIENEEKYIEIQHNHNLVKTRKYFVMDTFGNLESHDTVDNFKVINNNNNNNNNNDNNKNNNINIKKLQIKNSKKIELELRLLNDENNEYDYEIISTVKCNEYGTFSFKSVVPGYKYAVYIKQSNDWTFQKSSINFQFNTFDKFYLKEYFIIEGFDVVGTVSIYDLPLEGVTINLYSNVLKNLKNCQQLTSTIIKGYNILCTTVSDRMGNFKFSHIPCNSGYKIIPQFKHDEIKYQIEPEEYDFSIEGSGTHKVEKSFSVKGYPISGLVLNDIKEPIENVELYIKEHLVSITDKTGTYIIDNMVDGIYDIQVKKDGYTFNKLSNVLINPSHIIQPDIVSTGYEVSISIEIYRLSFGVVLDQIEVILYEKDENEDPESKFNQEKKVILDHKKKLKEKRDKELKEKLIKDQEINIGNNNNTINNSNNNKTNEKIDNNNNNINNNNDSQIIEEDTSSDIEELLDYLYIEGYRIVDIFNFDSNGNYKFITSKSNDYVVKITDEQIHTIELVDREVEFSVYHEPTKVSFKQLLTSINGKINTIANPVIPPIPSTFIVELLYEDDPNSGGLPTNPRIENGSLYFEFKYLFPNRGYLIKIKYEDWYWDYDDLTIQASEDPEKNYVEFVQVGFKLLIETPITQINNSLENTNYLQKEIKKSNILISHRYNGDYENLELFEGVNEIQISDPGVHSYVIKSCFLFHENNEFFLNTDLNDQQYNISLTIKKYAIEGLIDFKEVFEKYPTLRSNIDSIKIQIINPTPGNQSIVDQVDASLESLNKYHYSFMVSSNEHLELSPIISFKNNNNLTKQIKEGLVFYPVSRFINVKSITTCQPTIKPFYAKIGKFINGKLLTGQKDVKVITKPVSFDNKHEYSEMELIELYKRPPLNINSFSKKNGQFKIGPLLDNVRYLITAEKEGQIFLNKFSDSESFDLGSVQLYNITINVRENGTNLPFENAYISMIPKIQIDLDLPPTTKYVLKTDSNGVAFFKNIVPDSYVIKCHVLDFKVTPRYSKIHLNTYLNQIKDIKEFQKSVDFYVNKVAFSIMGRIQSINSLPFQNIVVQLFRVGKDESQFIHFQDTTTDKNGYYKFSNVPPERVFQVSISSEDLENNYYEFHSTPIKRLIKIENNDTYNNDFILVSKYHQQQPINHNKLQSINQFELSGNIIIVNKDQKQQLNNNNNNNLNQYDKEFENYILNSNTFLPNNIKVNVYYGGILIKSLDVDNFNTFTTILKKPKNYDNSDKQFTVKLEDSNVINNNRQSSLKQQKENLEIQLTNECIQQSYCNIQFELNYKSPLIYKPVSSLSPIPSSSLQFVQNILSSSSLENVLSNYKSQSKIVIFTIIGLLLLIYTFNKRYPKTFKNK